MLPPGSKRTKIRPPRRSLLDNAISGVVKDHGAEFDKSWKLLSKAIKLIQEKNLSDLSYEQLYRMAYTLVLKNYGSKLYDNVSQQIKHHLLQRRLYLVLSDMDEAMFLKEITTEFNEHLQAMKFISDVLMYMNRVHVKEHKVPYIYDLGLELFLENVIEYNDNEIGRRVVDTIILEIINSWKGQVITTKTYITKTISMMNELEYNSNRKRGGSPANADQMEDDEIGVNYYQRYFEPRFLSISASFFTQYASECLALDSGSLYIQTTSQFINEQESMLNFFLSTATHPKLMQLMCNVLIKDKIDYIIGLPYEKHGLSYWLAPVVQNLLATTRSDPHYEELRLLYDLVGRFDPERKLLKLRLRDRMIEDGNTIVQIAIDLAQAAAKSTSSSASKKPATISFNSSAFATNWINAVLDFRNQYFKIVVQSFSRDYSFEESITSAIKLFVNSINSSSKSGNHSSNNWSAPEVLSVYIDYYLKQLTKGGSSTKKAQIHSESALDTGITNNPVDELLLNAITFINLLRDRDAFEAYYANHFAKRFLNSKGGASRIVDGMDIEDLFISKVVDILGISSVPKLLKMNKETKLSWELTKEWKTVVESRSDLIEMELKICNTVDWPKSMTKDYQVFVGDEEEGRSPFIWPKQLRHSMKEFEEFWSLGKKNSSKTLFWSPKFGSLDLRISYPSRTYDINLSTYAGIIMLLFAPQSFNDDGTCVLPFSEKRKYTYVEIKELTQIPDADLRRQLQSIAVAPRLRLLVKTPMSKDVNDGDVFELNDKFKSPTTKVKVLTVSSSGSSSKTSTTSAADEESQEVNSRIIEGRRVVLDAAVVRIMKSRMKMTHNDLVAELLKQLAARFQPLPLMVKQSLAGLIEKDYIMRDPKERNVYRYIA